MRDLCSLIWCAVGGLVRSRVALQAEILVLRHQLNVLRRRSPKRMALGNIDRVVLIGLYRLAPKVLEALKIITPETVIRWHRAGFRAYWRYKSYPLSGRPKISAEICQMSSPAGDQSRQRCRKAVMKSRRLMRSKKVVVRGTGTVGFSDCFLI